jgi:nucleoside phosphorylase/PIN domain nuclease of toxin-antitoxin system
VKKYVTDTEPLAWFLSPEEQSKLGADAKSVFEGADWNESTIYVPDVVCIELLERGVDKADIPLGTLRQTLTRLVDPKESYERIPLDEKIAKAVRGVSSDQVPNFFDRIIVATAIVKECPLITNEKSLADCGLVEVVWDKRKGISTEEHINPAFGIITVLQEEYNAVKALLEKAGETVVGKQVYVSGEIPARGNGNHRLVLVLADMGNNSATLWATRLLTDFPKITSVIMVGIAGGIPSPERSEEHVRLGDIVVSGKDGVVQYDFVKEETNELKPRHPPRPPNPSLLHHARLLEAGESDPNKKDRYQKRPWLTFISRALEKMDKLRPSEEYDILADSLNPQERIEHPLDPRREKGEPRVFIGPIASANTLLKNAVRRDELRRQFGVRAVEMEGSGIADATWNHETGYFVVRGICDYCDSLKNDIWHDYAAIAAAAYLRALLESVPCQ